MPYCINHGIPVCPGRHSLSKCQTGQKKLCTNEKSEVDHACEFRKVFTIVGKCRALKLLNHPTSTFDESYWKLTPSRLYTDVKDI